MLSVGLLFSITSPHKPAAPASLVTGLTITAFAVTFATMGLWFSAAGAATNAVLWWLLLVQGFRQHGRSPLPFTEPQLVT